MNEPRVAMKLFPRYLLFVCFIAAGTKGQSEGQCSQETEDFKDCLIKQYERFDGDEQAETLATLMMIGRGSQEDTVQNAIPDSFESCDDLNSQFCASLSTSAKGCDDSSQCSQLETTTALNACIVKRETDTDCQIDCCSVPVTKPAPSPTTTPASVIDQCPQETKDFLECDTKLQNELGLTDPDNIARITNIHLALLNGHVQEAIPDAFASCDDLNSQFCSSLDEGWNGCNDPDNSLCSLEIRALNACYVKEATNAACQIDCCVPTTQTTAGNEINEGRDCSSGSGFQVASSGDIKEEVKTINIGFALEEDCPLDSFNVTRMTWTVQPAPEDFEGTYVGTVPPGLVKVVPMLSADRSEAELYFQPGPAATNYDGEAGVLILIPKDQLREIFVNEIPNEAPHKLQVNDGFTNLEMLWVGGLSTYPNGYLSGQGMMLKAKVHSSTEPLSLILNGNGIDAQVEASSFSRINLNARNSDIKLKGAAVFGGTFSFDGGSSRNCFDEGCGTTVLFEGEVNGVISASNPGATPEETGNPEFLIKVNDGSFSCSRDLRRPFLERDGERIVACRRTDEKVLGDYFPCTTDPKSEWDMLECSGSTDGCFCRVPVQLDPPLSLVAPSPMPVPFSGSLPTMRCLTFAVAPVLAVAFNLI